MALLSITVSNKITATVTMEAATARMVDAYAAYTKSSADAVVDSALAYVFAHDKDFQAFLKSDAGMKVRSSLRVKKGSAAAKLEEQVI